MRNSKTFVHTSIILVATSLTMALTGCSALRFENIQSSISSQDQQNQDTEKVAKGLAEIFSDDAKISVVRHWQNFRSILEIQIIENNYSLSDFQKTLTALYNSHAADGNDEIKLIVKNQDRQVKLLEEYAAVVNLESVLTEEYLNFTGDALNNWAEKQ